MRSVLIIRIFKIITRTVERKCAGGLFGLRAVTVINRILRTVVIVMIVRRAAAVVTGVTVYVLYNRNGIYFNTLYRIWFNRYLEGTLYIHKGKIYVVDFAGFPMFLFLVIVTNLEIIGSAVYYLAV